MWARPNLEPRHRINNAPHVTNPAGPRFQEPRGSTRVFTRAYCGY